MRSAWILLFLFSWTLCAEELSHDPFIIHGIPKCGIHYIQKISHMLTGKVDINHNISIRSLKEAKEKHKILRTFQPFRSSLIALLRKEHCKAVVLIRDPRDALVSNVLHMRSFSGGGVKRDFFIVPADFDARSLDEQLTFMIEGESGLGSYLDFYKDRMKWALDPWTHTVRYEDLVGSESKKRETILDLVKYLNLTISKERLDWVIETMYASWGQTDLDGAAFSRGKAGGWKQVFSEEHKKKFKKHFGKELIKLGYEKNNHW